MRQKPSGARTTAAELGKKVALEKASLVGGAGINTGNSFQYSRPPPLQRSALLIAVL
jgi:hypothetical protein